MSGECVTPHLPLLTPDSPHPAARHAQPHLASSSSPCACCIGAAGRRLHARDPEALLDGAFHVGLASSWQRVACALTAARCRPLPPGGLPTPRALTLRIQLHAMHIPLARFSSLTHPARVQMVSVTSLRRWRTHLRRARRSKSCWSAASRTRQRTRRRSKTSGWGALWFFGGITIVPSHCCLWRAQHTAHSDELLMLLLLTLPSLACCYCHTGIATARQSWALVTAAA